jgi:hypothetical protein
MLSEIHPGGADVLSESMAGVVGVLHPEASHGDPSCALQAAHGAMECFLRKLRHHLREQELLLWALLQADPPAHFEIRPIREEHRLLKQLSHDLCRRIRSQDAPGARDVARRFLAILLDHGSHEARVLGTAFKGLDSAASQRFSDRMFDRMVRGLGRSSRAAPLGDSVADLHSLYVRLIERLRPEPGQKKKKGVDHEHSRCG